MGLRRLASFGNLETRLYMALFMPYKYFVQANISGIDFSASRCFSYAFTRSPGLNRSVSPLLVSDSSKCLDESSIILLISQSINLGRIVGFSHSVTA